MKIKAIISFLVALVYGGFGLYHLDNGAVGYVTFALAAATVLAVFFYPDIKVSRLKDSIKNESDG